MKKTTTLITSILTTATALSGIILTSTFVSADDVVDEINITVPVSCSISGTGMNSHNATIANGQYNSAIGETTIKAMCNDSEGFAIYAIGYTDDEDGKNVLTSSTLGSTHDIATGTATSGNTSNWAMKLTAITSPTPTYPIIIAGSTDDTDKEQGDPDYSTFQEVPDDYALVAKRKSGTDTGTSAEGASFKTTYQAYISPTQSAGTYTGQVKYTMVHPHNAAAPEKPLGLCQSSDTCMQQQTSASMAQKLPNVGDTTTLYDARDNQAYTIAKLADGKYWMTENLNIAGGTALSSTDTNFDASYTLPTTNGWTVTDGKLILPASATKNDADNNLTDSTQFGTDNYAYVFNSGNKENCGASDQNTPCYSYYSWDTATLGSGRSISTDNTDADYSICPKNWKLPTSRYTSTFDATTAQDSDFYNLATNYGMSTGVWHQYTSNFYNQAGPSTTPNFLSAGIYVDGSFYSGGNYWSATSDFDSIDAHYLNFGSSSVYSADGDVRRGGLSVRCVFGS
ncbi:hypothetical protein IKD98_02385 [Candidatus Saccharibacteria bacterium]|nr:hypothetical protein [Candidatus Saccharibacteria bacterium]